ncbi:baculoviral IAP repeat-containing protein 7-like [Saccostrea cucullata]|uniref:baculoviral IAP repeat-containing protein 7-like n=1 Tax=Saccostrea cuccullata TaxID=36930 RepID=UPI002ECFD167
MTLTNWDLEDDPCAEHAYWNPNCPYINQYKGRSWEMDIFVRYLEQQGYKPLPEIKPLLNPAPDVQARGKCCICLDQELEIVFLPCGHVCCCALCAPALCAPSLQFCPICRAEIQESKRIFLCSL